MKFKFVFFSSVWCIQSDHRRPTSKKKYRFCVLDLCLVSRTLNLISLTLNDDFTFSCKSIDLFKSLFAVDVRCQDSWNSVYVFVWVCLCTRLSHYKFKNLEQTSVEQCDTRYREQTIEFVKKSWINREIWLAFKIAPNRWPVMCGFFSIFLASMSITYSNLVTPLRSSII